LIYLFIYIQLTSSVKLRANLKLERLQLRLSARMGYIISRQLS